MAKYNQRRVSMVKYLGELYNYRMVDSNIIFKTLYTLITYAVNFDVNESEKGDSLDPIGNFFRVRLVCVLLDTCGQYFDRGPAKKKFDCFLNYFQVSCCSLRMRRFKTKLNFDFSAIICSKKR